tara:strand:+ start:3159 stop:5546 length:2388 start_codon:yes stop_codon:yes gene_type:complete
VKQQVQTAGITKYKIEIDVKAEKDDGSFFSDHDVRNRLKSKGFQNPRGEWIECSTEDVLIAISEIKHEQIVSGTHHLEFKMRPEQAIAVKQTVDYFQSIWEEEQGRVPRYLWNAKMRFGKTFAAYQLAKELGAKRILVCTFHPAVGDAWKSDLETHIDFKNWSYFNKDNIQDLVPHSNDEPFVYLGSFQDLLGKDEFGNIKPKNEWIHEINWDLTILDEYHFGSWRETAQSLFEGEEKNSIKKVIDSEYNQLLDTFEEELMELRAEESDFLPITTKAFLYLSGTPFKILTRGEFIEEQIFNWTYTDEQKAKSDFRKNNPNEYSPYACLPEMRLFTYQMPDSILAVAHQGEFDEFDLNEFFKATGSKTDAKFIHEDSVQKWLNIIRGIEAATQIDELKTGTRPPLPYSDVRLLEYTNHSFWFLPSVAACNAMANLLGAKHNTFWHDYDHIVAAGPEAGLGANALLPVRKSIASDKGKSITLSCGKLTTGVTVPQWASILMLKNLSQPEAYFQAAFRVQSPWVVRNPNGDDPNYEEILKPVCFVFDFAPTRALQQFSNYGMRLNPEGGNPESSLEELIKFLPVLAFDGAHMKRIDAGEILDIAMSGTTASLLARKWNSALLVNVDNKTLKKIIDDTKLMEAVMKIEGFRALGSEIFETVVNKSESVSATKKTAKKGDKKQITIEEKEFRSKRKQIQEKLIKFATRVPVFMYLTDKREHTLQDIITLIEPDLFIQVTGLTVEDFNLLVSADVFNSVQMNEAVFQFRRYEDASLRYTGIDSHPNLRQYGLYDTVTAIES